MTSRDFCYWLQGHFEISDAKALSTKETAMVKRHLAMVFKHEIDPSFPEAEALRVIHSGATTLKGVSVKGAKQALRRSTTFNSHNTPIMC